MEQAVLAVADQGLKLREAALLFKVPLGTLFNRYKGKGLQPAAGRAPVFSQF